MTEGRVFVVGPNERLQRRELEIKTTVQGEAPVLVRVDTLGGLVTTFKVDGFDVIVPVTEDNKKRAGIPRLGPVCGPVEKTEWEKLYLSGTPQHGIKRTSPMSLIKVSDTTLEMESNFGPTSVEGGKRIFFDGEWKDQMITKVVPNGLMIVEKRTNLTDKPQRRMDGFHGYHNTPGGKFLVVGPKDQSSSPDLGVSEVTSFQKGIPEFVYQTGGYEIGMTFTPEPKTFVKWADKEGNGERRCWEPWWAEEKDGKMYGLVYVPRETKMFTMLITAVKI